MRVLLVLLALLVAAPSARGDSFSPQQRQDIVEIIKDALRSDPGILREALAALQADDESRHEQVTHDALTRLAPKLVEPADPIAGNPAGDVTVVEFYDTRCPYCRGMLPVLAALLRADPNIRLVMKDMPILGAASQLESRALLAAQAQGGYFKLQEPVMKASTPPTRDTLQAEADRQGLDGGRLLREMDNAAITSRLQANIELARQIGIDGTPAFVIGTRLISGAVEVADLQRAVLQARTRPFP